MTTAITQDIASLGDLPQWDLADLYPATDSAELEADLDRSEGISRFRTDGKANWPVYRETFWARPSRIRGDRRDHGPCYVVCAAVYAGNVSDPEIGRFYQSMQERVNDISADILFFR